MIILIKTKEAYHYVTLTNVIQEDMFLIQCACDPKFTTFDLSSIVASYILLKYRSYSSVDVQKDPEYGYEAVITGEIVNCTEQVLLENVNNAFTWCKNNYNKR